MELLTDKIYKLLAQAREKAYFAEGNRDHQFEIYITYQQYNQLKREILNIHSGALTVERDRRYLFGQRIIIIDEPPFVWLIGGKEANNG